MKEKSLPKHIVGAADALLCAQNKNLKTLTPQDMERLPEAVRTALVTLLQPFGWQIQPQQEASDVRYLSIAAAEKYASISRWTIGRAAARKEIQLIKLGSSKSSKILVDRAEIDRFMRSRRCR